MGLLGALALAACAGIEDAPLERLDLGVYTVSSFLLPPSDHGSLPSAQRLLGKTFVFGPNRILFPSEFGHADCQHEGYRLSRRSSLYVPLFDPSQGGSYGLGEAGITAGELLELWDACLDGVYLSADRGKMFIPSRGFLLVLDKQ